METVPHSPDRFDNPVRITDHALDNLRFIRTTLENAGSFTAVPGWGGLWMGLTALVASLIAHSSQDRSGWITTWIIEALVASTIGVAFMIRKAGRTGSSLLSGPACKFALGYLPPLVAGAALTLAAGSLLPLGTLAATWILLYGVAVTTGGAFSVKAVPLMGLCFMFAGLVAFILPDSARDLTMGFSFGVLHIAFGLYIARRFGG